MDGDFPETKEERDEILADQKWWNEALEPYGLQVYGWTYRRSASVSINGESLQITGAMRDFFAEAYRKIYQRHVEQGVGEGG